MKKTKNKLAASISIYDGERMPVDVWHGMCNWLRQLSQDFYEKPFPVCKTFRARYRYYAKGKK